MQGCCEPGEKTGLNGLFEKENPHSRKMQMECVKDSSTLGKMLSKVAACQERGEVEYELENTLCESL